MPIARIHGHYLPPPPKDKPRPFPKPEATNHGWRNPRAHFTGREPRDKPERDTESES